MESYTFIWSWTLTSAKHGSSNSGITSSTTRKDESSNARARRRVEFEFFYCRGVFSLTVQCSNESIEKVLPILRQPFTVSLFRWFLLNLRQPFTVWVHKVVAKLKEKNPYGVDIYPQWRAWWTFFGWRWTQRDAMIRRHSVRNCWQILQAALFRPANDPGPQTIPGPEMMSRMIPQKKQEWNVVGYTRKLQDLVCIS